MFAGVLLPLLLWQTPTPLDREITFRCPATRAVRLLPLLSKQTGLTFECDQKVKNEVLIVDVKAVKLRDLMNRLADVASAKWVLDSGRYRLERPSELEAELRAKEIDRLAGLLKIQIDKELKDLEDRDKNRKYSYDEILRDLHNVLTVINSASEEELETVVPAANEVQRKIDSGPPPPSRLLLSQVSCQLDLKQIAGIQPGGRLVLSTNPNALQRRMSVPRSCLVNYDRLRLQAALAMDSIPNDRTRDLMQGLKYVANDVSSPVAKSLLIVERDSYTSSYRFELRLMSMSGKLIDVSEDYLGWLGDQRPPKPDEKGHEVDWSPDSKAILEARNRETKSSLTVDGELQEKLQKPSLYDPLSTIVSDLFTGLAGLKNANLVGSLPDNTLCYLENASKDLPLEEFEAGLQRQDQVSVELTNSWLSIKPAYPMMSASRRIDREALAGFLSAYAGKGFYDLNDAATLARSLPAKSDEIVSQFLSYAQTPRHGAENYGNWDGYRLASQLTGWQWQSLIAGEHLPIRLLPPKAKSVVLELLYRDSSSLGSQTEYELNVEPTEAFPYGLPYTSTLTLTSRSHPFACEKLEEPSELHLLAKDFAADLARYATRKFWVGLKTSYSLDMCLSSDFSVTNDLDDRRFDGASKPVTPSGFPRFFLEAIRAEAVKKKQPSQ